MNAFQKHALCLSIIVGGMCHGFLAQTLEKKEWQEDLKVYKTSLEEKHIDLYHSISKEAFQKEWQAIYENVDTKNDFEIILDLMRLTRRINDGHTAISLRNKALHRFPFKLKQLENKWYVVQTLPKHSDILKSSLESINGIPIDTIAQQVASVAQYVENAYSLTERTASYLPISELLFHLQILDSPNKASFRFRTQTQEVVAVDLAAIPADSWEERIKAEVQLTIPELTIPDDATSTLWFAPIAGTKALYIQFKAYPTFEDMQAFGEAVVAYIQQHNLQRLIIDMRENGGGDLYVGIVLAYALNLADSIDWKDGVYVLTSNKTFSAATSNAALFNQLLHATLVGQPTGSNPNGYQDMDSVTLPHSNLVLTYSKRLFTLSNQPNTALQPDIPVYQKHSDFVNNIDTVLHVLTQRL